MGFTFVYNPKIESMGVASQQFCVRDAATLIFTNENPNIDCQNEVTNPMSSKFHIHNKNHGNRHSSYCHSYDNNIHYFNAIDKDYDLDYSPPLRTTTTMLLKMISRLIRMIVFLSCMGSVWGIRSFKPSRFHSVKMHLCSLPPTAVMAPVVADQLPTMTYGVAAAQTIALRVLLIGSSGAFCSLGLQAKGIRVEMKELKKEMKHEIKVSNENRCLKVQELIDKMDRQFELLQAPPERLLLIETQPK